MSAVVILLQTVTLEQPYSGRIPAGAKAPIVFAALIGPAKAVPLLQSHDRDTATLVLFWSLQRHAMPTVSAVQITAFSLIV
jgi:hypothetical protein